MQSHANGDRAEETKPDQEPNRISITDAVMLTGLTVSSYLFHYFFEYGYLSYFDIPAAFISFNLSEMIPAILFLVLAYLVFVFVLWPFLNDFLGSLPGILKTVLLFAPWLVIFVFLGYSWSRILLLFFGILIILGIDKLRKYRIRRMARKGSETDLNKEKAVSFETKTSFDSLVSNLLPRGNRFLLLYFFFLALVGSMAFGRIAAVTRTTFPVMNTSPRCAVVYATSDRFICKPFNDNKAFENSYIVSYYQELQNIEFHNEKIGPLHPEPTSWPNFP